MTSIKTDSDRPLDLDDFTYELPPELIAQEPPPVRHESRLLWVDRACRQIRDHRFAELPALLQAGDLLVVNDTRVIPARLLTRRESGARIELLLLHPRPASPGVWLAMAAKLRKLKEGELLIVVNADGTDGLSLRIIGFETSAEGQRRLLVDFGAQENVHKTLSNAGLAPLPPYIKRSADQPGNADLERYQTIFARAPGAVAAPTAGLHFSPSVVAQLKQRGVEFASVTLHVGPGTFKPITTSVQAHIVEAERYWITAENAQAINQALAQGRRIIAVGTTSCRTLEAAGNNGSVAPVEDASTDLYIKQGHRFRVVKALITNFHLSRSSLLVLVSAFGGHDLIMKAYHHAVEQRYRFYSYGDAMLIT